MNQSVKILHIDPDFNVNYFIYGQGSSIRSPVPLNTAINLLINEEFDLIISEPHNKAILKKEGPFKKSLSSVLDDNPGWEVRNGNIRKVRGNHHP
jgi:hypothetical protein